MLDGMEMSDLDLQRADGLMHLVLSGSQQGTRIVDVFQQSPIRILFPGTQDAVVEEAVLVNTAGGIAGGDRLASVVRALPDASATITSQAAERVYRALSEPAWITTKLSVCEAAKLGWLPQETIIFNGGHLQRQTELDLCSGSQLLALESLVLGRAAHGEEVIRGQITDSWRVKKDGRLIWADSLRVTDEVVPLLRKPALLADFKAIATMVYFGPDPDEWLQLIRNLSPSPNCDCVATVVAGLLVARFAARVSAELRDGVRAVLQQFGRAAGAGPFRIPKMWSC